VRIALDATPLTMTSGGLPRYTEELTRALISAYPEDAFLLSSDQPFRTDFPALCGPTTFLERRWWLYGAEQVNRRARIDVYHGTNFAIPYFPSRPTVMTVHDISPWLDKSWHAGAGRVRSRAPGMIRRATMIVTPTRAVRQQVTERFRLDPMRVVATPLAAAGHFRPVPKPPAKPYFLFVGTMEPRKNIPMLIEAWHMIRSAHEVDLVLAGRRRQDFQPLPPEPGLHVLGEVSEDRLPELYSNAVASIYPSQYEGFGLPVLEAMQCGAPAIISRDVALREVSGGAALEAGSAKELADAMAALAGNPGLRGDRAAMSLRRASEFSWNRTAASTYAVYEEAVKRFGR
jgi:glycosyltransferase involved in cell wall biosynthesis